MTAPGALAEPTPANHVAQLAAVTALHAAVHDRPELHRGRAHLTTILVHEIVGHSGTWRDVEDVLAQDTEELAELHVGEVVNAWHLFAGTAA